MATYSFDTVHAEKWGVDEAIMLHNILFWLRQNRANHKNKHQAIITTIADGVEIQKHESRTWTYNSARAYAELFPFWSEKQVERVLGSLLRQLVLIRGNFNKTGYDRTYWYALVDESLLDLRLSEETGQIDSPKGGNGSHQKDEPIPDVNPDDNPSGKSSPNTPTSGVAASGSASADCAQGGEEKTNTPPTPASPGDWDPSVGAAAIPPFEEEDDETDPTLGESDALEHDDDGSDISSSGEDIGFDADARYMILAEDWEPALAKYREAYFKRFGKEPAITEGHKQAFHHSSPGCGYQAQHMRGPLLDPHFVDTMLVFCRTPLPDWNAHDWEVNSNDLSPCVVMRDGPVNRLLGLVRQVQSKDRRNTAGKRRLDSLPPELAQMVRNLAKVMSA